MKFEIYCDESHPDAFTSKSSDRARFLLIGSLWLPADHRNELKDRINGIKEAHQFPHELKWHKVHKDTEPLFRELVELFIGYEDRLRFRCIAVEAAKVDLVRFHESDQELGFYKFYYQLIRHWIDDFNEYRIFCDIKTNRVGNRLKTLQRVLNCGNITSEVASVQALPSHEVPLIQLADLLLGMASSRMNESIAEGSTKYRLVRYLEKRLRVRRIGHTSKRERKYNVFQINLQGGW